MAQEDTLPDNFDVIVLGTGLPEAMIAGACARAGLSVLHLDKNDYYGNVWASFNLRSINEWVEKQKAASSFRNNQTDFSPFLHAGETALPVVQNISPIKNVESEWHIDHASKAEEQVEIIPGQMLVIDENKTLIQKETTSVENETPIFENVAVSMETHSNEVQNFEGKKKNVQYLSRDEIENEWRRFNLDLNPKILRARGPMVQILSQSEVSRYAEFKCVDRFLCLNDEGQLSQVPCSRGEIFQTEAISMIEKRRLTKFLTFALDWDNQPDEYRDFVGKPFKDFLNSKGLIGLLQTYIAESISILETNPNTEKITLLNLVKEDEKSAVRLLEAGFGAYIAPKGLFISHLIGHDDESTNIALKKIVKKYLNIASDNSENKPKLLWSLYFNYCSEFEQNEEYIAKNIGVVSEPDASLDCQSVVNMSRNLFERFWPHLEFLPQFPIREDENNPENVPENEHTEIAESNNENI